MSGAGLKVDPYDYTGEHDKVRSRLTGEEVEISFGPLPGGKIAANPFMSLAQSHYAYAHPDKFGGKKGLAEWSADTNYKSLPKKVTK